MLDNKTIENVKATVPILQEGGEALTMHFYDRMFKHNPEVRPLFNSANQTKGLQQQTLAAAICAYAENIDNLDALGDAVELIANKHASLRIQPEHYPIVGENLIESIKEVLGDAANEDIIDAWGKAYVFLADILIGREKQIYAEQETTAGGWKDFKKFKVTKKVKESDVVTSFYLEPEDGSTPPVFKPGQYITVRVPSPCGHTTMRNYSLSDKPGQTHFRISVKREDSMHGCPMGYVSNMLHNNIEKGQTIEIAPPCGEFFLDVKEKRERPLVLLAAGVGVTPVLSILLAALEATPERDIVFVQANLHENNHAFRDTIDALAQQHSNVTCHYRYSDPAPEGVTRSMASNVSEGYVDAKLIESITGTTNADFYLCGPKPFMINMYRDLLAWGAPESQVHFEFFGPRQEIENPQQTKAG
jgi:nitric oxide dioxygenase